MHLLLLLALGPMVYIVFRVYLAAAKVVFNFVGLMLIFGVLVVLSVFEKPTPSSQWAAKTPAAPTEQIQVAPCAEVEQLLAEPFGPGDLCDRYYKSQQCKTEIEAGFERAQLQLSPVAMCGTALPLPVPVAPLPESFGNMAVKLQEAVPQTDRPALFMNLHNYDTLDKSSLSLEEVRNTPLLPAFLAFAKPTGDALAGITKAGTSLGGAVVLEGVPMFTPFTGIVRGVYERTPRWECSVRVSDHSLCIERDGSIRCNVYAKDVAEDEQVCVDYLIR